MHEVLADFAAPIPLQGVEFPGALRVFRGWLQVGRGAGRCHGISGAGELAWPRRRRTAGGRSRRSGWHTARAGGGMGERVVHAFEQKAFFRTEEPCPRLREGHPFRSWQFARKVGGCQSSPILRAQRMVEKLALQGNQKVQLHILQSRMHLRPQSILGQRLGRFAFRSQHAWQGPQPIVLHDGHVIGTVTSRPTRQQNHTNGRKRFVGRLRAWVRIPNPFVRGRLRRVGCTIRTGGFVFFRLGGQVDRGFRRGGRLLAGTTCRFAGGRTARAHRTKGGPSPACRSLTKSCSRVSPRNVFHRGV